MDSLMKKGLRLTVADNSEHAIGLDGFPDEEGIKTPLTSLFAVAQALMDSLMKKGLRPNAARQIMTVPLP